MLLYDMLFTATLPVFQNKAFAHQGAITMSEMILNTKALPETLFRLIQTEKVALREMDGEIRLTPIQEPIDYIKKLRGSLASYPEMSVSNFLQRKYTDKELER